MWPRLCSKLFLCLLPLHTSPGIWRRIYNLPMFYPWLSPIYAPLRFTLRVLRPLRVRLGLELTGYTPIWKCQRSSAFSLFINH
ncbi:MAG: hypothetical protein NZ951_05145 [Dehalococcoidia bacterium]|nr:hypothetical protein [Dehalococcoidia bacterium]MDW8119899.1 hypothetical protein [Chloroflexota bacterium]